MKFIHFIFFLVMISMLGSTGIVYADAMSDLTIIDGDPCPATGSIQKIIKNTNTGKRIDATVKIIGNPNSYKYVDPHGTELDFKYPIQKEVFLFPGKTEVLGCSIAYASFVKIQQTFSVEGAFYPDPVVVFPPPDEHPENFVGWVYGNMLSGFTCEDGSTDVPLMRLYSRHPYRTIIVDGSDTLNGNWYGATIPPQSATSAFGCKTYQGKSRQWRIENIRFAPPTSFMHDKTTDSDLLINCPGGRICSSSCKPFGTQGNQRCNTYCTDTGEKTGSCLKDNDCPLPCP